MNNCEQIERFLHKSHPIEAFKTDLSGSGFQCFDDGRILLHMYVITLPPFGNKFGLALPKRIYSPFEFFCYASSSAYTQKCRIEFKETLQVDSMTFELLYQFHKYFFSDLSLTSIKLIDEKTLQKEELIQPTWAHFNLLVYPLNEEFQIHTQIIENLLNSRFFPSNEITYGLQEGMIVQSRHNSRTLLSVVAAVYDVDNFSVGAFLETIYRQLLEHEKKNPLSTKTENIIFSEIIKFYRIQNFDAIKNKRFSEFISNPNLDAHLKAAMSIKNMTNLKENVLKKIPILILNDIYGLKTFEHTNKNKHFSDSCVKPMSSPAPRIYFANDVEMYAIQPPLITDFMRLPSILEMFFQFYPVKIFKKFYNLNVKDDLLLIRSFCTRKFDFQFNFEALETLGDVILKVIQVFHFFVLFDDLNENDLTTLKSKLISNLHYSEIANELGLQLFIMNDLFNKPNFPVFKKKPENIQKTVTRKNMSDCFESLVGIMFLESNCLSQIFVFLMEKTNIFLQNTDQQKINCSHKKNNNFSDNQKICVKCFQDFDLFSNFSEKTTDTPKTKANISSTEQETSFLPNLANCSFKNTSNFIQMISCSLQKLELFKNLIEMPHYHFRFEELYQKMVSIRTVKDLKKSFKVARNYNEKRKLIDKLEILQNIIGYKFNDLSILLKATENRNSLNFQRYELFGDVLCEVLAISSTMSYFRKYKIETSPELLQIVKVGLLSNLSMTKFIALYGIDECIGFEDKTILEKLEEMKNTFKKNLTLEEILALKFESDLKSVSDIWEALCFAVFLDGGWDGLIKSYLRLYSPFLFVLTSKIALIHSEKMKQY